LCAAASLLTLAAASPAAAQAGKGKSVTPAPSPAPALVRTTTRHEIRRFGFGNTLTIGGAPVGSVTVEGWSRPEVEITADVELRANTEEELALLAGLNTFLLDEDATHFRVVTTGTHDRQFMKKVKNFPRHLLAMPWKIDYRVKAPAAVDLEIFAGRGAVKVSGVEGALQLNAGESDTALELAGGDLVATILGGKFSLDVTARSWRGRGASVRVVSGEVRVALPANFIGEIEAKVLRSGRVEDAYGSFAAGAGSARDARTLKAVAGSGGARLQFEVGDGLIRFERYEGAGARR
jgi:hypothetical protein